MQRVEAVSGKGCAVKPSARYSTLQDLDAGRHTEIDMFSGALIRMGRELGIPTPYNEFAYHMIKALEEKNDGRFDYSGPDQERHGQDEGRKGNEYHSLSGGERGQ